MDAVPAAVGKLAGRLQELGGVRDLFVAGSLATGDGHAAEGVPFTAESVERILTSEPMASPGAACLALAWKHRHHLLP